jgi:Cu/Ag efflux protein CusF
MFKRLTPFLIVLMVATTAHAQRGGGGGGGGGRGGGGGGAPGGSKPASSAPAAPKKPATPLNQLPIIGVVKAIDVPAGRITIAYEPVEALGWPAGTQPFPVGKTAMLTVATVGQKVRFSLDDGQISALKPFDTP